MPLHGNVACCDAHFELGVDALTSAVIVRYLLVALPQPWWQWAVGAETTTLESMAFQDVTLALKRDTVLRRCCQIVSCSQA